MPKREILCPHTIKILIFFYSHKGESKEETKQIRKSGKRKLAYPLIQIFDIIIPTIYRFFLFIDIDYDWMKYGIVICGSIQSILFPISYGLNSGLFRFSGEGCSKGKGGFKQDSENTISIIMSDLSKTNASTDLSNTKDSSIN